MYTHRQDYSFVSPEWAQAHPLNPKIIRITPLTYNHARVKMRDIFELGTYERIELGGEAIHSPISDFYLQWYNIEEDGKRVSRVVFLEEPQEGNGIVGIRALTLERLVKLAEELALPAPLIFAQEKTTEKPAQQKPLSRFRRFLNYAMEKEYTQP